MRSNVGGWIRRSGGAKCWYGKCVGVIATVFLSCNLQLATCDLRWWRRRLHSPRVGYLIYSSLRYSSLRARASENEALWVFYALRSAVCGLRTADCGSGTMFFSSERVNCRSWLASAPCTIHVLFGQIHRPRKDRKDRCKTWACKKTAFLFLTALPREVLLYKDMIDLIHFFWPHTLFYFVLLELWMNHYLSQ
jgi:hypothetical protein